MRVATFWAPPTRHDLLASFCEHLRATDTPAARHVSEPAARESLAIVADLVALVGLHLPADSRLVDPLLAAFEAVVGPAPELVDNGGAL